MSEPVRLATEDEHTAEEARRSEMEAESTEALAHALAEVRKIARDLFELSQVQFERARMGVRSGFLEAKLAACAYVAAIATTIVAVYFFVDGLSGGLGEVLGSTWAGRMAGGLAVLVVLALAVAAIRSSERRSNVKRMREKFGEPGKRAEDDR